MKKIILTEEEKEIVKLRLDLLQLNHKYDALFEKSISVMRKVKDTLKGLGMKSNDIDDFLKPFELAVVSGQLVCYDCANGRDEFEPDWKCPECRRKDEAN